MVSNSWNSATFNLHGTNPSRTYAAGGTYTVTLIVTDGSGATSTATRSVTVTAANQPPTANFTSSCSGLTCSFTNTSTDDVGVASNSWNFGDGSTSTATNPSRTYAAGGTYTVTLIVTDGSGATSTATRSVTVTAANQTITLSAVWRKSSGVHFADLSWSGAVGSQVEIYRNGTLLTTTANDGAYTDRIGRGPRARERTKCVRSRPELACRTWRPSCSSDRFVAGGIRLRPMQGGQAVGRRGLAHVSGLPRARVRIMRRRRYGVLSLLRCWRASALDISSLGRPCRTTCPPSTPTPRRVRPGPPLALRIERGCPGDFGAPTGVVGVNRDSRPQRRASAGRGRGR